MFIFAAEDRVFLFYYDLERFDPICFKYYQLIII